MAARPVELLRKEAMRLHVRLAGTARPRTAVPAGVSRRMDLLGRRPAVKPGVGADPPSQEPAAHRMPMTGRYCAASVFPAISNRFEGQPSTDTVSMRNASMRAARAAADR